MNVSSGESLAFRVALPQPAPLRQARLFARQQLDSDQKASGLLLSVVVVVVMAVVFPDQVVVV